MNPGELIECNDPPALRITGCYGAHVYVREYSSALPSRTTCTRREDYLVLHLAEGMFFVPSPFRATPCGGGDL